MGYPLSQVNRVPVLEVGYCQTHWSCDVHGALEVKRITQYINKEKVVTCTQSLSAQSDPTRLILLSLFTVCETIFRVTAKGFVRYATQG